MSTEQESTICRHEYCVHTLTLCSSPASVRHQTVLGKTEQRALSDVLLCHIDQGRRNSIVQAYSWPPPMQCCIQPALPFCKQLEDDQPPFRVEKV